MAMLWNPYTGDNPPDTWDESDPETLEDFLAHETADRELTTRPPQLHHGCSAHERSSHGREQDAAP